MRNMYLTSRESFLRLWLLTLMSLALTGAIAAQPADAGSADALFAEAKSLAGTGRIESQLASLEKFEAASSLYTKGGLNAKVTEVALEHGRALRQVGMQYRDLKAYDKAITYFELALPKLRAARNRQEEALAFHDLGFVADRQSNLEKSDSYYQLALAAYRDAGDRNGEAIILRNQGVQASNASRWNVALAKFQEALKARIATTDEPGQGELLSDISDTYQSLEKWTDAATNANDALKIYRRLGDRANEAASLYRLGVGYTGAFRYAEATDALLSAQAIYRESKETANEALTLLRLGRVHVQIGEYAKAESSILQAVEMYKTLRDINSEAGATLDLAANYTGWSRMDQARVAAARALELFRQTKDRLGEASSLLVESDIHSYRNQHDDALAKIQQAKKIYEEIKSESGLFSVLRSMISYHYTISNYAEAIRDAEAGLQLAREKRQPIRELDLLVLLGSSYSAMGQHDKAHEYEVKALDLSRKINSPIFESIALNNIGYTFWKLNRLPEAKNQFLQSIVLLQKYKLGREEGYARHNLGLTYYKLKDYKSALAEYDRALPLYHAFGDRRPEAFLYDSYGELYRDLGEYDKAIINLQKAVVLAREIRYSQIEGNALANMMEMWSRRGQPRLAVLYGKQAVNVFQSLRAGNSGADKASQKSLLESNEKTYRQLANVLIEEGRLAEAQQVLDLLKAEEYFGFVRRDASEADQHAALALSESEKKALEEYSRVSANLTSLGSQFQTLQDKRNKSGGKLPEAEEAEYVRLKTQVETAGEGLKTFFSKLASEFSKKVEDGAVVTPESIDTLKADLRRVGSDVVLVSTYLLPERYRAIVTTGRTMVDRKVEYSAVKLTGADINKKIFEFQRALQNPRTDPRPLGKELYDIFVKPLEKDLRDSGAKTILWSLDGSLRYIPMAALSPDGKTYLAQRYQNVVVTLGRQTNLFTKPSTDEWRAIGAGVSKQHAGFSALPSVPAEIGSIVRDAKGPNGVLDGTTMLDEQFNLDALRDTVPQQTDDGRPFNVVHLATHFSLGASDQDSALLLGDGTRLSLFAIGKDQALDFKDVELLTLSACQTGVATGDANGREVESLGMLAQKKGAKAVLATLWKVADESTALFMTEFYRIKKANPTMNKAEAIRLAQKEMIDGRLKSTGTSTVCRADDFVAGPKQNEFKCDPNAPYSHPYFWSPFVLIGNWR